MGDLSLSAYIYQSTRMYILSILQFYVNYTSASEETKVYSFFLSFPSVQMISSMMPTSMFGLRERDYGLGCMGLQIKRSLWGLYVVWHNSLEKIFILSKIHPFYCSHHPFNVAPILVFIFTQFPFLFPVLLR